MMKKIVIVGGGFAGINAARDLGNVPGVEVTLIDRRNHHLFQPLLYQVAMSGLSPADIATPIRSILSEYKNVTVIMTKAEKIDAANNRIETCVGPFEYDELILACGARHTYFGNNHWEKFAPGLKTVTQATEIRRRVLTAFERAEAARDEEERAKHLHFVVVGGGPTGVELAGAIGEMARYTLKDDFRNIDPKNTKVTLLEAGPGILPMFDKDQAAKAQKGLEQLGVQVRTGAMVTDVDENGVTLGDEKIVSSTVLWGAGVAAAKVGTTIGVELDRSGRVVVQGDLSIKEYPNIFVLGDQSHNVGEDGKPLPGMAPVAMQHGKYVAKLIKARMKGKDLPPFKYLDKGKMATIGRNRAIAQTGNLKLSGWLAWMAWLLIHVLYLNGFKNRFFVTLNWGWQYISFRKASRLIVGKKWAFFSNEHK